MRKARRTLFDAFRKRAGSRSAFKGDALLFTGLLCLLQLDCMASATRWPG